MSRPIQPTHSADPTQLTRGSGNEEKNQPDSLADVAAFEPRRWATR